MFDRLFDQDVLLFTIPAIVGTIIFGLKLAMMLAGGVADADVGPDIDVSVDGDALGEDSTQAFTLVSIQAIAALLMGFGWGGVAALLGLGLSMMWSVVIGTLFGAALVWLLGIMMKAIFDLQADGNIGISQTVGLEGVVYAEIPVQGGGRGQVRVVVDERLRVYNAVSQDEAIPSQTRVRVVAVVGDNSLAVMTIS